MFVIWISKLVQRAGRVDKKSKEEDAKTIMNLNLLPKGISIQQMRKDLSEEGTKFDRELKEEV